MRALARIGWLVLVPGLSGVGCDHKVEVGKYEEHGPSVTHHSDGSTTADSGGRSFRLVNVERDRPASP